MRLLERPLKQLASLMWRLFQWFLVRLLLWSFLMDLNSNSTEDATNKAMVSQLLIYLEISRGLFRDFVVNVFADSRFPFVGCQANFLLPSPRLISLLITSTTNTKMQSDSWTKVGKGEKANTMNGGQRSATKVTAVSGFLTNVGFDTSQADVERFLVANHCRPVKISMFNDPRGQFTGRAKIDFDQTSRYDAFLTLNNYDLNGYSVKTGPWIEKGDRLPYSNDSSSHYPPYPPRSSTTGGGWNKTDHGNYASRGGHQAARNSAFVDSNSNWRSKTTTIASITAAAANPTTVTMPTEKESIEEDSGVEIITSGLAASSLAADTAPPTVKYEVLIPADTTLYVDGPLHHTVHDPRVFLYTPIENDSNLLIDFGTALNDVKHLLNFAILPDNLSSLPEIDGTDVHSIQFVYAKVKQFLLDPSNNALLTAGGMFSVHFGAWRSQEKTHYHVILDLRMLMQKLHDGGQVMVSGGYACRAIYAACNLTPITFDRNTDGEFELKK